MTTEGLPGAAELRERFATFRYSLFRLEALQTYGGSGEEEGRAAFEAGQLIPLSPALRKWTQMLRQRVGSGCAVQRVHVVTSPLTDYMRFELASYAPNVQAGEDIRIISVPTDGEWPRDVPPDDFWLIDSSELWNQRYDQRGTWLGVDVVTDPAQVVQACRARDAALHQALPWADYLRDHHPEIVSYLASAVDRA
ncbi:MAG: hypothetical protein LC808_13750 [Actinobacteria bacterium]|nr:hypothetical protein [Acidobacteriota bacterium]MCA1704259.1 hypothetical protein [Actinomycetota bacterium]